MPVEYINLKHRPVRNRVDSATNKGDIMMNWLNISTAPRDGTLIEIKCCFGLEPWYSHCRWDANQREWVQDDRIKSIMPEADRDGILFWRPL